MNKDIPTDNMPDEESLYALGRDQLWFDASEMQPGLTLDAEGLIELLLLEGYRLPSHFLALKGQKISKLVLTFGRYGSHPYGPHYEVGVFDGEGFRSLDGYRIYPDPTHWIPLPKPPRTKPEE